MWKPIWAKRSASHRSTATRNRFNDVPLHNARGCDAVNSGVRRSFRPSPYTVSTPFASSVATTIVEDQPLYHSAGSEVCRFS